MDIRLNLKTEKIIFSDKERYIEKEISIVSDGRKYYIRTFHWRARTEANGRPFVYLKDNIYELKKALYQTVIPELDSFEAYSSFIWNHEDLFGPEIRLCDRNEY